MTCIYIKVAELNRKEVVTEAKEMGRNWKIRSENTSIAVNYLPSIRQKIILQLYFVIGIIKNKGDRKSESKKERGMKISSLL